MLYIWMGPKSGFLMCENIENFVRTSVYQISNGFFNESRLYSKNGEVFRLKILNPPRVGYLEKWLSATFYNRKVEVELGLERINSISLEELKRLVILQSERDSGDLMWQFSSHEEICTGVSKANSFQELFLFCESNI